MINYDYVLNVYYGEKYICSLGARNAGGYDNVIWWLLKNFIETFNNKEMSRKLLEETIEQNEEGPIYDYFHVINEDLSNNEEYKIDFLNKKISLPTHPLYSPEEFKECWGDVAEVVNQDGVYYMIYEESEKFLLKHIEFDEKLLIKEVVTFDEFFLIEEFYSKLMDEDYDYILNNNKIIKFNII